QYLQDLKTFNHVLMGRNTYEFGYQFGVQPGDPSPTYAHMQQYIISDQLTFEKQDKQVTVLSADLGKIRDLKQQADTDIYLCGGGKLAGWLLKNNLIDEIKIKLSPVILGTGIKLFEEVIGNQMLVLINHTAYDNSLIVLHYRLK
ncbi:MAG: dihydrofolate reductase family protein, partial [Sphingobacterium sp.]